LHQAGTDFTVLFYNPNIRPESEYIRRRDENKRVCEKLGVPFIELDYDNTIWVRETQGLENEPERGKRCLLCYEKRMEEAYQYAEAQGFDYFTTVMTISRQKDSLVLNRIGEKLGKKHPTVPYFHSDFKKNNGILKGAEIRKHYGLYNQTYCGCEYSLASRLAFDAKKKAEQEAQRNDDSK
jgi:predicted adenine nucleotide alpha hydrolase (AANH) superfamily ATPase